MDPFSGGTQSLIAAVVLFAAQLAVAQEVPPGVWIAHDVASLPLATAGYDVYLVGELHGIRDNERIIVEYLAKLDAAAGVRDVAIEEDAVYEPAARAYVEGRSQTLPPELCLRAGVFDALRDFNAARRPENRIRVHLVDIDTPAPAILAHLARVRSRIANAKAPAVPDDQSLKRDGLKVTDAFTELTQDPQLRRELRTIRHSIRAYQDGLEAGTLGRFKGSPYLEDRETAIAANIQDIVQQPDAKGVLAQYGSDHVSKRPRADGGPDRNTEFAPMALRLLKSGLKVYSLMTYPLSGRLFWRTGASELVWTAADGTLSSGERLDHFLARTGSPRLVYVDRPQEHLRLPSKDASGFEVNAYLLIAEATAMQNRCVSR